MGTPIVVLHFQPVKTDDPTNPKLRWAGVKSVGLEHNVDLHSLEHHTNRGAGGVKMYDLGTRHVW